MATALVFLPQAPHQMWQTAASPFILPTQWQSLYQRCPRCGGNAPNVCEDVWPANWWEDDYLGLMYQGHIPPSQRVSPWEQYYSKCRVQYPPAQPSLHINTDFYQGGHAAAAPMTPPMTPGFPTHVPSYHHYYSHRPTTPESPTLPYRRQGTVSSFDSAHSTASQAFGRGISSI